MDDWERFDTHGNAKAVLLEAELIVTNQSTIR